MVERSKEWWLRRARGEPDGPCDVGRIVSSETGWVIEHGASEPCKPRYWAGKSWDGLSEWTYDHMKAIRFAREIDAQRVAEAADDGVPNNYRVCEHAWYLQNT